MIIKNIPTFEKVTELFLTYRAGDSSICKIQVRSNPHGRGSPQWLWAFLQDRHSLSTWMNNQHNIDGIDYAFIRDSWNKYYKGTFNLDTAPLHNIKPEVYKKGDTVEVLENVTQDGCFNLYADTTKEKIKNMIGKTFPIQTSYDNYGGVYYEANKHLISHYAVRKVVDFDDLENNKSQETTEDEVIVKLSRKNYNKLIELLNSK